jgi:hypothetical protein
MSVPKRIYYIDSHRRVAGTDGDFTIVIQLPSMEKADAKGISVVCLSASIPKSWYLIPVGANTITLQENGVNATVTIPVGNYGVTSFISAAQTALNAASLNAWTYTITFSQITGKFSYAATGGGVARLIMPAVVGSGIHEQWGFAQGSTSTLPITGTNVVKFVAKDTIQIRSDIIDCGDDVLQDINTSGSTDFSSVKWLCPEADTYAKPMRTKNGNVYRFYITDEDGNPLVLNGLNVVFTIMVYMPLEGLQRDYLRLKILE